MSPYRKGPAGTAEKLHSQVVRMRANGICERCGQVADLQAAHIIRRSRAATRTDERNGWGLCAPCHWIVDDDPGQHSALVERTIGLELYAELRAKNDYPRPWRASDWRAETKRLRGLLNEMKSRDFSER